MDLHRQSHVLLFTDSATADDPFCGMIETFSARFRGQLLFVEIGPDEIQLASTFGYKGTMRPQVGKAAATCEVLLFCASVSFSAVIFVYQRVSQLVFFHLLCFCRPALFVHFLLLLSMLTH
jgi:hypothetical protein